MNRSKYIGLLAAVGAFAIAGVVALAQVINPPITPVNQNDVVQVVKAGQGTAQSVYAYAGTIGGTVQYQYSVPVTAFTITAANGTTFVLINPAGTLGTGTLTTPASPGDGQSLCMMSSQTQTALTVTANTGQTMASYGGATVTALTANTPVCWFYIANQANWVRYL
jgi:hypothetical protein